MLIAALDGLRSFEMSIIGWGSLGVYSFLFRCSSDGYHVAVSRIKQSGKTWAIPKNYTQTDPFTSN
jgi:hypothetical protein